MNRASLFVAAAIVAIANGFGLAHVRSNQSGPADADITLTERELIAPYAPDNDDSGITLNLMYSDPRLSEFPERRISWLSEKILREVGFDTSVSPSDPGADEFYRRQLRRRAFVALEYDGPARQEWYDFLEQHAEKADFYRGWQRQRDSSSALFAIDASDSAARLRARHPNRTQVMIVPAVIRIAVWPFPAPRGAGKSQSYLVGSIEEIPTSIHVPLAFSDGFRRLPLNRSTARYRVHLRYGASLEPMIVGVEFMPSGPLPELFRAPGTALPGPPPSSAPR